MFPKISDLISFLFDIHLNLPFQTYGFVLTLAFLLGGMVLRSELKRKEKTGLLAVRIRKIGPSRPLHWINIFILGIFFSVMVWKLAGIIFNYERFVTNPQKFIFSMDGNVPGLIITAIIYLAIQLFRYRVSKPFPDIVREETVHPYQNTWNIMIVAIISAIAGSKFFDILDNLDSFVKNPMHSIFSFNGFAFYGGFFVTVIALLLYMRVVRLDWKHVIDCSAPAIMIGYAVGRLGCHLSGDGCWGVINTLPQPDLLAWLPDSFWANRYPHNVINYGIIIPGCTSSHCRILAEPVFPTSLYESILSAFSFSILWITRKHIKAPVVLFGVFLLLYGTERFLIEQIRINNKYDLFGMQVTQAEISSVLLILTGAVVMVYFLNRNKLGFNSG
ncbi:MAG: prolipoprotein diacylglyceryl transferase family protein [Bacteroidota bacterium]